MLPDIYEQAIYLIDIEERPYSEAAKRIGISVGALKSRVRRGRKELSVLAENNMEFFN